METDLPLLVLVGPTGIGKTALAVNLAQMLNGEIVSADSRQVYRYLSIGTAKPTQEEIQAVPHHLVDFLSPDYRLTLAEYQQLAYQRINAILARKRFPLLVGGTGQYVRAVVEGWSIPHVPPDRTLRTELEEFADLHGSSALHDWLESVDQVAADSIDHRNVRRVIRALEVYLVTGTPISVLQQKKPPPYRVMMIGLTMDRERLYARVDRRIAQMLSKGLVEEIRELDRMGFGWHIPAMSSLGYPEIKSYLEGEITLEEAERLIQRATRRFIRHQYNWFKVNDPDIQWFDAHDMDEKRVEQSIRQWLVKDASSQS